MDSADAVIVGAGHNGLVAANLLADAGWDVIVCEQGESVGGAVRSAELTPGFVTDLFSAFYPLAAASPVIQGLDLERFGLRWSHAPQVLAHLFPDDRAVTLSRDLDRTAASLQDFGDGDGDRWRELSELWQRIDEPLMQALTRPLPALGPVTRMLRRLGSAEALRLARTAVTPVRRLGEEWFSGTGGPILLAGNALHADLPPEGAGSGLYGWILCMLAQHHGFPVPVGGSGRLTQAMADRFTAQGGIIRTGAEVSTLGIRNGRVQQVRLRSGETISARRAVLADVPAPALYTQLLSEHDLPPRLRADIERFQWDAPTMKINWALDRRIPWSNPDVGEAGTVHLGVDLDGLTQYAADLAQRRPPERPFVLMGQMTTSDPSRSATGTESAWAYTHLPKGTTADELAEQVARVESLLERHAPGFGAGVVARHVQTPAQLQQDNPALWFGAINGGTAQLHQQLIFRPVPGLGSATTHIDRLFLASSSAHPGGGVHGACGANAARAALRRDRPLGALGRRGRQVVLDRLYS